MNLLETRPSEWRPGVCHNCGWRGLVRRASGHLFWGKRLCVDCGGCGHMFCDGCHVEP